MSAAPYVFKRGAVYWWRRRLFIKMASETVLVVALMTDLCPGEPPHIVVTIP